MAEERLLATCAECRHHVPATRRDDGSIQPLGAAVCPECGGEAFREAELEVSVEAEGRTERAR